MALDFYIIDHAGDGLARYSVGDIVDITSAAGPLPSPNLTCPFRIIRVQTTRTKAEVESYLEPKTTGQAKRRAYYLNTAQMSAADLAWWNAYRSIETTEATAVSWISKK